MRVLDLFAGIGGFSLGLERAGMKSVAFCEIEPYCCAVLRKNWPDVPIYDDVRTLTAARLAADGIHAVASESKGDGRRSGRTGRLDPSGEGQFVSERPLQIDLICGGFPCQDISVAGKGAGIEGERSGLWSEYARIISEVRPSYVIVENVAALLGRGLSRVLGDLASLGYDAEWHCIPASAVGAPHRRDRLWIVAHARCERGERRRGERRGSEAAGSRDWPARSGQYANDVADAIGAGLEGRPVFGGHLADELAAIERGSAFSDADFEPVGWFTEPRRQRHQWESEPDVGRVVDGFSTELDFSRQITEWCDARKGDHTKAQPTRNQLVRRLLRAVWEHRELAEASPDLYVRGLQNSVPEVPFRDSQSRWFLGTRIEKDQGLCDLW